MKISVGAVKGDGNVWKKFRAIGGVKKKRSWEPPLRQNEPELVALCLRDRMHAIAPK